MNVHHTQSNQKDSERGFTLLLAALVASIVLALGASIFAIAQKELTLSSIGRDSQRAFYAADTAAECALYWDIRNDFASSSSPTSPISCDGNDAIEVEHTELTINPIIFTFTFEPNGFCANVSVKKSLEDGALHTLIRADGFSSNCVTVPTNPRVLQRSVELQY